MRDQLRGMHRGIQNRAAFRLRYSRLEHLEVFLPHYGVSFQQKTCRRCGATSGELPRTQEGWEKLTAWAKEHLSIPCIGVER